MKRRTKIITALGSLLVCVALTFIFYGFFTSASNSSDMLIDRHPVKGSPSEYLFNVRFYDSNGATFKYSFLLTEKEEDDALQYAIMEHEKALDFIITVRNNYFTSAINKNSKLIEMYEKKKD